VTGDDLAAFLANKLAKYKIPRRWLFLDVLPRTAYGKVVKGELQRLLTADPSVVDSAAAPGA
jgi:acyl-CoA synthetase (AMP-forming)/AMP-acid ligase II